VKLRDIIRVVDGEVLTKQINLEREIESAAGCDLMSDVLTFSKPDALLLTGLTNIHVIRTAEMADLAAIVFVRGKLPEPEVVLLAEEKEIPLISAHYVFDVDSDLWRAPVPQVPQVTKVQELIYELPIGRVMTTKVITLAPETPMRELKEVLRVNRISGTPVVEGERLVGVISIEDLIKALENGDIDAPVRERMSRSLVTIHAHASLIEAIKKFAQFQVGRLPVIGEQGELIGILTGGDIIRGLLEVIGLKDHDEESQAYRTRPVFEDLVSDETFLKLSYRIKAGDFKEGGRASSRIKRALLRLGAAQQVIRRVAIAAYEAEMNLIIHTERGGRIGVEMTPEAIHLVIEDTGPGIANVDQAMQPGYSTASNWIRELGFGAGMGLMNIKRCADAMRLESTLGVGTRLEVTVEAHHADKEIADCALPKAELKRKSK
jgi:CBS domain-containing protein/anti-sigma regulatory factor (Ser/Thr protein kinase)